ncbi:coiled-coil domain-containing protein 180 [Phaenicophaeus curvirostris]|uniref:coiled-coil domain-containing protein 180 n=1 Tax=Phaenicophaeus curvirostris TaxID=33595 RepID=UPI0037F0D600
MYCELACIAREMEPLVSEPGKSLLTKLVESDRKIELLFKKIEFDATLEGFSIEDLEELWNAVHQEFSTRKKWIREMDETLKKAEWSRADKVTDVLRKYTVLLEEISFYLPAEVYRFMNDEAMLINRTLLANQRALAKLFVNLMKTEMERELSHRLKWQDRVRDWKLIRKNSIVHSFREFMANEEIQSPPAVKAEMENMLKGQISLSERRLEFLQHLCDLLPPTHTGAEVNEWSSSLVDLNKSIDTHNVQCMTKIRIQYEMVQQKCLAEMQLCKNNLLNLNVCTEEEAEEIVNSELLQLTEKLKSQFEEKLEQMGRDFEELAEQNEQNCRALYCYVQEAMGCWDVHQLKLFQLEGKLQKRLDECRRKQNNLMQKMEDKLDKMLEKIRTASSEKILKKYFKNTLSSLGTIGAKYEPFNQVLMDKVMTYPEAVLQELISYSLSISQYFNVKEIFKQNLQGEIEFTFRDQGLGKGSEAEPLVEQQAESIVQGDEENEEINTAENKEVFAQEAEKMEQKEDAESIPQGSEEAERAGQDVSFMQVMFNGSKAESSEIAVETFSTSSGNTYTALGVEEAGKTDIPYFTKYEKEESLPMYLKYVLIKETMLVELKKQVRLRFFEHLEKWFAESLSNTSVIVAAKGEELNSELQLHLHLHQQRQENIKKCIYDARAVELSLHKEHLERLRAGVVQALEKEKDQFLIVCDQQNNIRKNLRTRIREMESVLLSAPMNDKLVAFSSSLHSELHNHLQEIQVSLTSYQNYLTETLGKLRDSNMDFLTACRSFSEGGNFSPEEVKSISKCVQEENKRIDSFESSVQKDMKKMELSCLQQDTELIKRSETKLQNLFMSRVFMEKIRRTLKNLQMQIKSEVANSNLQAATLNSYLEKLRQKRDVCAHPTADKEALTAEELYDFVKVVLKELKNRSQYLDCLREKTMSPQDNEDFSLLATDVILQGPIAVAIRKEHLRDENKVTVMGLDPDKFPVLSPSRRGKPAVNDLAISIIKNLLEIQPPRKSSGLNLERKGHSHLLRQAVPSTSKKSHVNISDQGPQKSATQTTKRSSLNKKTTRQRMKIHTRSVLSDERFQIFGEKPPEADTFKGAIMNILWMGNNSLLCLAEEFYQKEMPPMVMPEDLPDTLERCAEIFQQSLLSYQSQTDNYYNSRLMEFQNQLKLFEKELSYVSQLAVDGLFKEHEQKLNSSTGRIRHLFNKQLEVWEKVKAAHKNQLHPSLGHPAKLLQLDTLCQEEMKRQKDHVDGVHLNTQMLQDCAAECARNFVSALAAFTEKLLLELDESITSHDVQAAKTEIPREKTSTLIRPKQARLPLDICEVKQLTKRGSRSWPGIAMMTLPDNSDYVLCRETASVTTAKTTLGHVAAVEARDVVYEKYKCKLEQQFAQIKKESAAQLLTAQRWEEWWKRSIQKIKQLYT